MVKYHLALFIWKKNKPFNNEMYMLSKGALFKGSLNN